MWIDAKGPQAEVSGFIKPAVFFTFSHLTFILAVYNFPEIN